MLLAAGREVVSKTPAYNITKLSYRVEARVFNTLITEEMINLIIENTNKRLEIIINACADNIASNSR